jgi:5-oxoprolinase (ATP-hydrolysing) subunit A
MATIALTADVGESFGAYTLGDDASLIALLTEANIACGFHAGDPLVMDRTVSLCIEAGVALGAHPGFPDLKGFGRRAMDLSWEEARTDTLYQIGALSGFVQSRRGQLSHVTPHGRLGNLVVVDPVLADAVADAVASFDPNLIVVTQEGELAKAARARGLEVGVMFLADRAYEDNGQLVKRTLPGAVLHDPAQIAERAVSAITTGAVSSVNGADVAVAADLVLLHGDNLEAIENARLLREALENAGVEISPLRRVLANRHGSGL